MTFKDKGIILRETFVGEADKIVTALLLEHGKISLSVRGARKTKSKYLTAIQPFCLNEFVIFERNNFYSVTQAEIIENFYELENDYDMYCYASFFTEMADKMIYPEMPSVDTLRLLIVCFRAMIKKIATPKLSAAVFQIKFLQLEGFAPEFEHCSRCGASKFSPLYFYEEGLICKNCLKALPNVEYLSFTEAARNTASYIINSQMAKLFKFSLPDTDIDIIYNSICFFRKKHVDINFKSLELM